MKKIFALLIAVAVAGLTSCSKDNGEDIPSNAAHIVHSVEFLVQDIEGNDLMTTDYFDIPNFRISYYNDEGEKEILYDSRLVQIENEYAQYGYGVWPSYPPQDERFATVLDNYNLLAIILSNFGRCRTYSEDGTSATATCYFHWSDELTDVFETKFEIGTGYDVVHTIYINGELIWERSVYEGIRIPYIKIVIDDKGQRTFTSLGNPSAHSKPEL